MHVGTNVVTVRFFLAAPGTTCMAPPASSVWAGIDPSSSLTLPPTQGTGYPDLSLLPFPMVVNGDLHQTLLIVPGRAAEAGVPSGETLNAAVLLGALPWDWPTMGRCLASAGALSYMRSRSSGNGGARRASRTAARSSRARSS